MSYGGWRLSRTWVANFISCVDNCHSFPLVVREFHNSTVATEKERWWMVEWDLGTSRREALLSTVLVLRLDFLQAVPTSLRWVTCWICALWSTVNAATLRLWSRLSLTAGSAAAAAGLACLCCCYCCWRWCCCRRHGCWYPGRLASQMSRFAPGPVG